MVDPVQLLALLFSSRVEILDEAAEELSRHFGAIDLASRDYPFDHTRYYEREMGSGLVKRIVAFEGLVDPGSLAAAKAACVDMEKSLASRIPGIERAANLDPGYLTDKKVVLASTKDRAHRVYLGGGIYAESALEFVRGGFQPFRWTYADYLEPVVLDFFERLRERYLEKRRVVRV